MSSSNVKYDKSQENSKFILIILGGFSVFVLVSGFVIWYMIVLYQNQIYVDNIDKGEVFLEIKKQKIYEKTQLENYGIVNEEKNLYRIPIEKAMKKLIKNTSKKNEYKNKYKK